MEDLIRMQEAIDKFIDRIAEMFADIREIHVDDSVCGLCEYDGAYLGQSGDWCNECPGFEKDDCFKLSGKIRKKWTDEIIKALPSADSNADQRTQRVGSVDLISRQAAIDALKEKVFSNPTDEFYGAMQVINELPSAQPKTGRWIEMVDADPMTGEPYVCGVYCSECGERIGCESNFCPNCGAYMRGEQE